MNLYGNYFRALSVFVSTILFLFLSLACAAGDKYDAKIISEEITYNIHGKDKSRYSVHSQIEVLKSDGGIWGIVSLPESRFFKIKKFEGWLFNTNGDTISSLTKKDGFKVCGFSEYAFYDDACLRIFDLTSNNPPYTIEYYYELEMKSLYFWPEWTPQKSIPVSHSKYTLIIPREFTFKTKENGAVPPPAILADGKKKISVYEMHDIEPYADESYIYDLDNELTRVSFVADEYILGKYKFTGGSWSSFGNDCFEMMRGCFVLSDEQKILIENIRDKNQGEIQIARRLHEQITDNTRYVAIEIDIGGWKPTTSKETFERGYGDCKDLSTLYVSMLNHVGIESKLALALTREFGSVDPLFPNLGFNHVIYFSIIDGDTIWSDPTCSFCDVGDLPWHVEDIFVLAFDSSGGHLVATPNSAPHDNICHRKVEIDIESTTNVHAKYSLRGTGNVRHMMQSFLVYSDFDKMGSFLKESDFGITKKLKYDNISINEKEHPAIFIKGKIRNAITSMADKRYLSLDYFSFLRSREKINLSDRIYSLDLKCPISFADSIIINVPSDWKIDKLPETVDYEGAFGTLHIDYEMEGTQLIVSNIRESSKYYIPEESLTAFRDYLREIGKLKKGHLVFKVEN